MRKVSQMSDDSILAGGRRAVRRPPSVLLWCRPTSRRVSHAVLPGLLCGEQDVQGYDKKAKYTIALIDDSLGACAYLGLGGRGLYR